MTEPVYTTVDNVVRSPDIRPAAADLPDILRHIQAGARMVDGFCHRKFYPWSGTKRFDWPTRSGTSWRLWLNQHDLISATALRSGGQPVTDYLLYPLNDGPPYTNVQINRGGSGAFISGDSEQAAVEIDGLWGYDNAESPAGTLDGSLNDTATTVDVTAHIAVGELLRVDTERLLVVASQHVDSGQTGTLTESISDNALTLSDATGFEAGDSIYLDAEQLDVTAVLGNTLVVKRAQAGTTLADHTAAAVFWPRRLTVERAAAGTTAAAHSGGAAIVRHVPVPPVEELNRAYALDLAFQHGAAWARSVGAGESEREYGGRGIRQLEQRLYDSGFVRRARIRSV